MRCPLKEAAQDAPHQIGLLEHGKPWTFSELDHIVDQHPLLKIFSCWRKGDGFEVLPPHSSPDPNLPAHSLIIHTSGSTGTAKKAVLSAQSLLINAKTAIKALDLRPNDQWKLSLPLHHIAGMAILLRCILARATVVVGESPHITHLSYVPTQLYRSSPVYKHLRCLLLGGGPIHIHSFHLPIYKSYGLTEMGSIVSLDGKILPEREIMLGSDGEIFLKGPCLFDGYLNSPPQKGWFATKDLGKWEHQSLVILGRKDWMFISGGENIYPEEIEQKLNLHPAVFESAITSVKDPEWGQKAVALVHAKENFSMKAMKAHLENYLPRYKIPKSLYLTEHPLPRNNFKLNRFLVSQYINNQIDPNMSGKKNRA